jgi:hypothetical protein
MSVGVSARLSAARRGAARDQENDQPGGETAISKTSQAMNGAVGLRATIAIATATVLITPPTKTGRLPNRLPMSSTRMSSGTPGRQSASQRVTRQRGKL